MFVFIYSTCCSRHPTLHTSYSERDGGGGGGVAKAQGAFPIAQNTPASLNDKCMVQVYLVWDITVHVHTMTCIVIRVR